MAVFGGIFSRKDKKSAQDQSSVPASPVVSPPSPATLKKPSPLPKSYNSTSPEGPRERSHRPPTRPSLDANRALTDPRERRRDVDDDDATTTHEGEYVLPLIDSPSLMNGLDRSDYFSSSAPSSSKPLAKKPPTTNKSPASPLLPSVNLSPISLPMTMEEDEEERPLGLRLVKPSRSTPPEQVVASAGAGNSMHPRGHTRNASSLEGLSPPSISTNVAPSVRSLQLNSPTSPVTGPGKQRIPTHLLSVPRPSSPTESSTSHFPMSPSSIGCSDSTRPTSPTSIRSKATIPKFGAPLLKFSSSDPPPQLNTESESKSSTKANRTKSKEREKDKSNGSGMFSFMRDRKKSSPNPSSPSAGNEESPSPTANAGRGSIELLGRISFSSTKSESQAKHKEKDDTPPPPVPPLPSTASLDTMPPLRPIHVDRKPSEKGFVPPVRRKYVPPSQQATGTQEAEGKDGQGKQGSFELVSFRHVRPVSPGPAIGVGAVRSTSPGPFQGLELKAGRDRSGSFASDTSASKTTVSAFRQAQQRRGTGLSSAASEGRRSTADLLEEAETRKSMDAGKLLDSLPLPGPPPPAPVELPEPVRPYVAVGGASPRGSLDGGSRPSTPPVRPPRTHPPPGVRGASPVNHRDKIGARGATTPRKGVTQSAYGQLYSSTTSSDEDDSEDDDSSDDDVPLGVRGRGANVKKAAKDGVSRKTTITQKNAPSTTSLGEFGEEDEDRASKRDTIIAPKQTQTSSHIRAPAASAFGNRPAQAHPTSGARSFSSSSGTPGGRSPASTTPAPAATVPLGTPIARPHKPGVVVPPPRSSSLFVDTKRPASAAVLESTTSPTNTIATHNRAHSASLLGGGLAGYSTSKASKSLGSVNVSSPSPTATTAKRSMPPPLPKSKARPSDFSTSDESESEKSSSDDDAPLGLLKRPGSSLSMRSHQSEGWGTRSELNHGVANHGGRRPALKNGAGNSSSGSIPPVPRPPPRDARRPPPPGPSSSISHGGPPSKSSPAKPTGPTRPKINAPTQTSMQSVFAQPPMRPFAGGAGMGSSSFYASSPGGSSNGDSYGSSIRLPLTPRDGSELGTTSGSSLLGGKKEGASPIASAMAGKKPYHGRKSSVTFEELPNAGSGRKSSEEEKRKERRREEAKAAIQMGKAINGPPPQISDDETDLFTQQSKLAGMPNLGAAGLGAPGMNMPWDPQLFMMMQAQQAQMMAAAMNMNMGNDPNYMAHQQAMLFAKQAYQLSVAQQAMEAAGDEWERASNVNGPAGGSVSGASMLGGAGGLGGMGPFMGMGTPGMMGMPMGMGMPMMNMGMGMGMPGMLFPPAPSSAYGGSTSGSVYGGGSRIRPNFPGSASVMGDPAPSEAARSRNTRTRTNTAPSNAPLPAQHSSRLPPPPSSWKP